MAIPFLNNLDITDNQLLNAKLHVTPTAPTAAAGQIYFNSTDNVARYHDGTTWIDIPRQISVGGTSLAESQAIDLVAGTNVGIVEASGTITISSTDQFQGTVTGVSASTAGDALDVTVTNATTTPDLDFTWAGNSTQYIDGAGNLTTFPAIPTVPSNIVETITTTDGTYINLTPNSPVDGAVTVTADLSAVDGTAGVSERYLTKNNTWAEVSSIPGTYDWGIQGDNAGTTTVASGDVIDFEGGTNVTTSLSGTTLTINSTDQFQGTLTGITEGAGITVTASATSPTVAVDYLGADNYLLEAGAATVAGSDDIINFSDDTDSNVKKTTLGTIPVNSLTLVKNYIDSSVSGGVYYQGGYDPTTDLTSPGNYGLQTPPNPNIIEIGWMYTVTADGTFFGEQVRVGDVLIAEIDAPTSLSDWTTVQNNIDLATSLVVGLGNVVPGSSNTITAPYSSGTATLDVVDSTPSQKGAVIVDAGTGISVSYVSGTATVTNTQTNSANTYAETITDTDLTIDHNLGTKDVIVQLYDVTTDETVYADVERISTSRIGVTFSATPTNSVRVLVQKIG
jgi:hypothetical protein